MNSIILSEFIAWTKQPPHNINIVINMLKQSMDNDMLFSMGIIIIRNWSYSNNCIQLLESDVLDIIHSKFIVNKNQINGLYETFSILSNIIADCGEQCIINDVELLLNRFETCLNVYNFQFISDGFIEFVMSYSFYHYNESIFKFFVTKFIEDNININFSNYIKIIKNFYSLEPVKSQKIFNELNFVGFITNPIIIETFYIKLMPLLSLMYKNNIKVCIPYNILEVIWLCDNNKSIDFICKYIKINPTFKTHNLMKYFINDIVYYRCSTNDKLKFYFQVFNTDDDFKNFFNIDTFKHVCSFLSKKQCNLELLYILLRKIYDFNQDLFNVRVYNKILRHPYGSIYFCKTLKEKAYSACLHNKIKVNKIFINR